MPRHSRGADSVISGACKIRKLGYSSSSSTPSLLRNYPFKKGIAVGKRGKSSTPVPTWKLSAGSLSSMTGISESPQYRPSQMSGRAMQAPVSARKLATALWELNMLPPPHVAEDRRHGRYGKEVRGNGRTARSVAPHLYEPSHSPDSERTVRSVVSSRRVFPRKKFSNEHNQRASRFQSNDSLVEIETHSQGRSPIGLVTRTGSCLKDLKNGLVTSRELLKLLYRIWGLKEKHSSSSSLVSALRVELDRACLYVDQIAQEQISNQYTINNLKKRFVEEKTARKSKEQEKITSLVHSIMAELESEKKLRRRAERLNKNLGMELAKTKASLMKVARELESEKRSRETIEQVCNGLVKGVGYDKTEVEELKRESAKVLEELEKEREMLHLADEWREERVQMKLSDAKFQYEEKNAAVERLRNELEAFLATKRVKEFQGRYSDVSGKFDVEGPLQLVHQSGSCGSYDPNVGEREEASNVEDEEDSGEEPQDGANSVDSDLHSIELNMDSNNKKCTWSYATAGTKDGADLDFTQEEKLTRITESDQISSFEGININNNFEHPADDADQGLLSGSNNILKLALKLDQERYASVKGLRDRMLAASRMAQTRGLASPTRHWS